MPGINDIKTFPLSRAGHGQNDISSVTPVVIAEQFGEPTLLAVGSADAVWSRGNLSPYFQKSSTGWLANLYGGTQTGSDFAAVFVPVNELLIPSFSSALWTYFQTNAEVYGVNMVIWAHDPLDNDKRMEITQAPSGVTLEKGAGWNAHELNIDTTQFFFYGENTTGTNLSAGTQYTWAQFQADILFKTWTITRISFEMGWYSTGTFEDVWVADIKLNGIVVPLKPDGGGSGRIGRRHFTTASGDLTGTLAPKTPFQLLSLDVHVTAIPNAGELLTLTKDAGRDSLYDTVIYSFDLGGSSATSLYKTFEGVETFAGDDEIDLFHTNSQDDDYGVTITYQTVF